MPSTAVRLRVLLVLLAPTAQCLLWFPGPPNNLGDLDGLTAPGGRFYLRYNNGACNNSDDRCAAGPGGHCPMGIHAFASASSEDGVHWQDHGSMLWPFDEAAACPSTSSGSGSVWRGGGKFNTSWVINYSHGATIRFMLSGSPNGPWSPVGSLERSDGWGPGRVPPRAEDGAQWYQSRWDTMNAWPAPNHSSSGVRLFAWNTATAKRDPDVSFGFMTSIDGVSWTAQPPARLNFGAHQLSGGPLENGGCAWVSSAAKWYCLNGFRGKWAGVDHTQGMATFVSDSPGGPYSLQASNPLLMAYRSSQVWYPQCDPKAVRGAVLCDPPTYFARFWLRYDVADPSSPAELLVVHQSFLNSDQMVYLAPLKRAVVDANGTLRLHWWEGNSKMKGAEQWPTLGLEDRDGSRNLTTALNNRNGTILEGLSGGGCAGGVRFYGGGEYYEVGVDRFLVQRMLRCAPSCELVESVDRNLPPPAPGAGCHWRVVLRGSMAEVYVNDVLTLPIPLPNTVTGAHAADWASGVRAPAVVVGLTGAWAVSPSLKSWTIGLPALFPMD